MPDRIGPLGAIVFSVPAPEDIPALVARIVRPWGELKLADEALALELARKLPAAEITREDP